MIKKEDIVKVGVFTKPHGIKGEIGLATHYDVFHTESGDPFVICEMDGIYVPFFIESQRTKTATVQLVKLATVDSEEAARELAGKDAFCLHGTINMDEEPEGWDLLAGYTILDKEHGLLGELTAVDESTMNILLQVNRNGTELLIPAVEEWIVSIDHRQKQLVISLPDGLLDM